MAVRVLHAHSAFSLGGKEARAVRLMNAFGDAANHTILSGMPDQLSARQAIARNIAVDFPDNAPSLTGRPGLTRLFRLARYMKAIGRAHVCTPVTNAHIVFHLLLVKTKSTNQT